MTAASDIAALAATDVREPIPMDKLIPVLSSPPFIPSRSLINIRDAGLVPGSALPANRIYRCGALDLATKDPEAVAWLAANVKRVFDLRRTIEREAAPDPEVPGVENVWLKGHDGEELPRPSLQQYADEGGASVWREQYMSIAMVYRPTIKALLEHVRDRPEEPFLFHCTAGRDRTGVVAGLLHHLAGTPPEAATGDYMLSRLGTEPARDKLIHFAFAMAGTDDINAPGFHDLVSLKPEYWEAFVERLTEKYGGWDGYVTEALGFSAEDLAKMKKNLRP